MHIILTTYDPQENERFDILLEVSVDNLGHLFLALDRPVDLRQSVTDVIFHVLASLRESTEALDRVRMLLESTIIL